MTLYIGPSPTQQKTLDDIRLFISQHGFSPTIQELCEMAGIANNAAAQRVDALVKKGYVSRRRGVARSLLPVETSQKASLIVTGNNNQISQGKQQQVTRYPLYLSAHQLSIVAEHLRNAVDTHNSNAETLELLRLIDHGYASLSKNQ
jgi:SOS-response transcriptional repressor LexA